MARTPVEPFAQALALARAVEAEEAGARDALERALRADATRAAATVAMAWTARTIAWDRTLDAHLGQDGLARALRQKLGWRADAPDREAAIEDAASVLAAQPTGARAKKVGEMRAWLDRVERVPPEAQAPLFPAVIALLASPSLPIQQRASLVLRTSLAPRQGDASLRDVLVKLLIASKADGLVGHAANAGSEPAIAHVAALAARKGAPATLRFGAARHANDAEAMRACYVGKPTKTREEVIALAHWVDRSATGERAVQALADGVIPALEDASAAIRGTALDLLASLAARGARVADALEPAAASLGDTKKAEHVRGVGAWTVRATGAIGAALLGAAVAGADGKRAEKLVRDALASKKGAVRQDAALALGMGLRRAGRWPELERALRDATPELRESMVRGCVQQSLLARQALDLAPLLTIVGTLGIEPSTLRALSGVRLPPPRELGPDAIAVLLGKLSTVERIEAVGAIHAALERGARIGALVYPLAGVLICGDYAVAHPGVELDALVLASRREGPSPAAPFLGALVEDRREDIRAAASEIAARAGATLDEAPLLAIAQKPFTLDDAVALSYALPAARHAAEALDALARRRAAP